MNFWGGGEDKQPHKSRKDERKCKQENVLSCYDEENSRSEIRLLGFLQNSEYYCFEDNVFGKNANITFEKEYFSKVIFFVKFRQVFIKISPKYHVRQKTYV